MEIKQKVLSALKWRTIGTAAFQLISWATTLIVIRLLAPEDYGLMAMAGIFSGICSALASMGLGSAIVYIDKASDYLMRQIFGFILGINLLLVILLIFLAPHVASYFEEPVIEYIMYAQSLNYFVAAFSIVPNALLLKELNFKSKTIIDFCSGVFTSILTVTLALSGHGVWALVWGTIGGTVCQTILLNIKRPFFKFPALSYHGFGKTAAFGGLVSLSRLLWQLYTRADAFIIGKFLNAGTLGFYSIALQLSSLPLEKVGGIINQVAFPAYSTIKNNAEQVTRYTLKVANITSLISFPVFAGLSLIAPEFVILILGDKWVAAIVPIQILSLVMPLRMLNTTIQPAIAGIGRPGLNTIHQTLACIILPTSFYIGVSYGVTGVAIGWLCGYTIWFILTMPRNLQALQVPLLSYLSLLVAPIFCCVVMFLTVSGIKLLCAHYGFNSLVVLLLSITTGAGTYITTIRLISPQRVQQAIELVRNKPE